MTIRKALKKAILKFKNCKIPNPQLEAELLLSFTIKKSREFVISYPEYKIPFLKKILFKYLISRRAQNYSLAIIIKSKEFYGYEFIVNKYTLVPRPETEIMIDEIINNVKRITNNNILFADIGTGSGCILISLIKQLQIKSLFDICYSFLAIDISKQALKIAKQNAHKHHIENIIDFHQGNLLEPIINKIKNSTFDIRHSCLPTGTATFILTANLPYLTPQQVNNSPSIQKEPKLALVAGNDGLLYYKQLFKQIKQLLKNNSIKQFYLICEIDPTQIKAMKKLSKEILNLNIEIKKDLCGLNRFVIIKNY